MFAKRSLLDLVLVYVLVVVAGVSHAGAVSFKSRAVKHIRDKNVNYFRAKHPQVWHFAINLAKSFCQCPWQLATWHPPADESRVR
jgi:hypothetical protein